VLRARSRDNARTPMQWDASPQAGFTTGTPWLAVNPNHDQINAESAVKDPDSVYHFYRRLIALRHEEPAVVYGEFAMLLPHDERLYAFTRTYGDTALLVIGNFSGETVRAEIDDAAAWEAADLLLTNAAAPEDLVLQPWQVVIYRQIRR